MTSESSISTLLESLQNGSNEEELHHECQRWALAHGKCGFSMFVFALMAQMYFFNIDFKVLFNVGLWPKIIRMSFLIRLQFIHLPIHAMNIIVLFNFSQPLML